MRLDPNTTVMVAIDMHRGHLDPTVATLPLAADRCQPVIDRAAALFREMRTLCVPVVHVVTEYRDSNEIASNPFWAAIHNDSNKARQGILKHNLLGSPGTEIIAELISEEDLVVRGKKRYSGFYGTDLEFLLRHRLKAETVVLAGINTTTCILCNAFEATNRDFKVIIASEAVDSMDGEEMHRFALRLMDEAVGWTMTNREISEALRS